MSGRRDMLYERQSRDAVLGRLTSGRREALRSEAWLVAALRSCAGSAVECEAKGGRTVASGEGGGSPYPGGGAAEAGGAGAGAGAEKIEGGAM
eukprot:1991176-Rhodomonas_salina.1